MSTFRSIDEIRIYGLARAQAKVIWADIMAGTFGNSYLPKDFGLIDQINRSSGSAMDNVAEGFGRGRNGEFIQFLGYARGSNEEVKAQIQRAFDRSYYSEEQFQVRLKANQSIATRLSNFITYLVNSSHTGNRRKGWDNTLEEPDPGYEAKFLEGELTDPTPLSNIFISEEFFDSDEFRHRSKEF